MIIELNNEYILYWNMYYHNYMKLIVKKMSRDNYVQSKDVS